MSTPFHQYRDDVPSTIAQKLGFLREQEERMLAMEKEMEALRGQHAMLEAELAPYRKATMTLINPDYMDHPINRLPEEMLALTFEYFIADKHRAIAVLLFVCKRWHSVVTKSPRFWARIEIKNAFDLFDLPYQKSVEPYIAKCLELSAGLPLHVHLNLSRLPSLKEYIREVVSSSAYHVVFAEEHARLAKALALFEWDKFYAPAYRHELDRALKLVIGDSAQIIRRWSSLYLSLPIDDNMEAQALIYISLAGVSLTSLEVYGRYEEKHIRDPFGDMSTIKHLTIGTAMSLSRLGVSQTTLQVLNIRSHDLSNLSEFSNFTLLHTLTIIVTDGLFAADRGIVPSFTINLPRLHTLNIENVYWRLAKISWVLPSIKYYNLRYIVTMIRSEEANMPQISARHLGLEYRISTGHSTEETIHRKVLEALLSVSPDVETLTAKRYDKGLALRTISSAKRQGRLHRLKQLTIEDSHGMLSYDVADAGKVDTLLAEIEA